MTFSTLRAINRCAQGTGNSRARPSDLKAELLNAAHRWQLLAEAGHLPAEPSCAEPLQHAAGAQRLSRDVRSEPAITLGTLRRIVGAHGVSRVAFLLTPSGRRPALEINTVPGLSGHGNLATMTAAATALAAGVPFTTVLAGLEAAEIVSGDRMQVITRGDGVTVINDTFNASPEAMLAAIEALEDISGGVRRRVAVIGEMAELGDQAGTWHTTVAGRLTAGGIDHLITVGGKHALTLAETAREAGITAEHTETGESVAEQTNKVLQPDDVLLIKGSNALGLGAVARQLTTMTTA
ncbi:hypothetical protein OG552_30590 [Streptomyces sp. NBC_01476]|uniref:glutamate ligase domain-containing protein n=1 Tax=Streptomyces sp. NBC_01476 TaxID=2903881 RepID=UPI002E381193|nr:cyanophycin synthetase [Streptomyces sp. NBC_01476]